MKSDSCVTFNADAMLADETLRLALLSSQVVMDLLPVLQSLARKSAHSLQSQIATSFPGSSAPDDAGLDGSLVCVSGFLLAIAEQGYQPGRAGCT